MTRKSIIFILSLLLLFGGFQPLQAAEDNAFRTTNLPLPRFVSLASDKIYVRSGPGKKYPIKWEFNKKGLPVEIILEYEVWRKIRDYEGAEGWVHQSLVQGNRTGLVLGEEAVSLRRKPAEEERLLAYVEPGVIADLEKCDAQWCKINASGYEGWVQKNALWGVYPREIID